MKPEQLKKLAEWYYGKLEVNFTSNSFNLIVYHNNTADIWRPHKDSNQLDQLEDKMVKSFPFWQLAIWQSSRDNLYYVQYDYKIKIGGKDEAIKGGGKTKNEARLNAILNYVESK